MNDKRSFGGMLFDTIICWIGYSVLLFADWFGWFGAPGMLRFILLPASLIAMPIATVYAWSVWLNQEEN